MTHWLVFVISSVVASLFATIVIKHWTITNQLYLFWIGLGLYTISTLSWIGALKFGRLAIVEALWNVATLILILLLALLFYHEKVSWREGIGLILAVIASILLTFKF